MWMFFYPEKHPDFGKLSRIVYDIESTNHCVAWRESDKCLTNAFVGQDTTESIASSMLLEHMLTSEVLNDMYQYLRTIPSFGKYAKIANKIRRLHNKDIHTGEEINKLCVDLMNGLLKKINK